MYIGFQGQMTTNIFTMTRGTWKYTFTHSRLVSYNYFRKNLVFLLPWTGAIWSFPTKTHLWRHTHTHTHTEWLPSCTRKIKRIGQYRNQTNWSTCHGRKTNDHKQTSGTGLSTQIHTTHYWLIGEVPCSNPCWWQRPPSRQISIQTHTHSVPGKPIHTHAIHGTVHARVLPWCFPCA